jgi:lipopolysaccharide export system permease protein
MLLTFFIALFILLMQFLWKYVDDIVGKGFEWYVIMQLLFYASATFVPLALPLAVLLASLMTFGNLGEHYELVAIKAAGISFRRAMMPLVVFSILLSAFAFYFSNNVLPVANLKFGTLLYDVREKKPALSINEGVFYNDIDGYTIRIGKKEADGVTLHNIMIYDHTEDMGNVNVTVAESGIMENTPDKRFLIFKLFNGNNYYEKLRDASGSQKRPFQRTKFKEEMRRFDLSSFKMSRTNEELFKDHYQMLNLQQLLEAEDTLRKEFVKREEDTYNYILRNFYFYTVIDTTVYPKADTAKALKDDFVDGFSPKEGKVLVDRALNSARGVNEQLEYIAKDYQLKTEIIVRHEIEWHRKFTLSIACLILFFIGAPLGAIIRKGGLGLPVVFATLFFILFHIVSITGEKAAREGVMSALQGMWLASLIFLPIGVLLTYSASTDSRIMSGDFWISFFKMITGFLKGIFVKRKK